MCNGSSTLLNVWFPNHVRKAHSVHVADAQGTGRDTTSSCCSHLHTCTHSWSHWHSCGANSSFNCVPTLWMSSVDTLQIWHQSEHIGGPPTPVTDTSKPWQQNTSLQRRTREGSVQRPQHRCKWEVVLMWNERRRTRKKNTLALVLSREGTPGLGGTGRNY